MARIKADVRREEILRATCREVIARGFASTRVGDVAAALGVSTGLVFYHFTNKETLLGEAFGTPPPRTWTGCRPPPPGRQRRPAAGPDPAPVLPRRVVGGLAALDRLGPGPAQSRAGRGVAPARPALEADPGGGDPRGVAAGEFACPDPDAAAWRLTALLDGLGVQVTVHRSVPDARLVDWVRAAAAAELAVDPSVLAGQALSPESTA